jgi:hypothetical protein
LGWWGSWFIVIHKIDTSAALMKDESAYCGLQPRRIPSPLYPRKKSRQAPAPETGAFSRSMNPHLVVSVDGFGESSDACENPTEHLLLRCLG